jgi:hypothetical protein
MSKHCYTREEALNIIGPYDDKIDYVGPGGGEAFVPRYIMWVDMNKHAYEHDIEYIMGGTEEDKLESDLQFMSKMMHSLETAEYHWSYGWMARMIGRRLVLAYYSTVTVAGNKSFCFAEDTE